MRSESRCRSLALAAALAAALGACSGEAEHSKPSGDGGGGTTSPGSGGSAVVDGQGGSGTSTTGPSTTTNGMGGSFQNGGAGGSVGTQGSGGSLATGGTAGSAATGGSAGSAATGGNGGEAGGTSTDGVTPPIAECLAFCASTSPFCSGPNTEVATSTDVVPNTTGCRLTVELPSSGTVAVDLDCTSGDVCIEQGSGCLGAPGECYTANWGASGFSYFIPGCLNGSLGCSLPSP